MRDPNRIRPFLAALGEVWERNPDQRFGQLVMNLSREPGGFADTWEWENDEWFQRMEAYLDEPPTDEDQKRCCVCGTTEDLRVAPLMTGDRFGEETKWPVCGECFRTWYETGETTAEGILRARGISTEADV